MAGFMKLKGLLANGVGTRVASNDGGLFPVVHYVDKWVNPTAPPTQPSECTLVTTVAAGASDTDLTIVAAVAATLAQYPRSLTISADAAQTENCEFTGTDQFGNAQTETIAFNGTTEVNTTKVWGSITNIKQKARSGAANIGVGLGPILGTSHRLIGVVQGYVFATSSGVKASVRETTTPLKTTTADVHGATWTSSIAATNTYWMEYLSDEAR